MKKFYVVCGTLREIVLAANPHDACAKALLSRLARGIPTTLDPGCFCVDERGYRDLLVAHNSADLDQVPEHLVWTNRIISPHV